MIQNWYQFKVYNPNTCITKNQKVRYNYNIFEINHYSIW